MSTHSHVATPVGREASRPTRWGWRLTQLFGAILFLNGAVGPFTWATVTAARNASYLFVAAGLLVAAIGWEAGRGTSMTRPVWLALGVSVLAAFAIGITEYLGGDRFVGGTFVVFGLIGLIGLGLAWRGSNAG